MVLVRLWGFLIHSQPTITTHGKSHHDKTSYTRHSQLNLVEVRPTKRGTANAMILNRVAGMESYTQAYLKVIQGNSVYVKVVVTAKSFLQDTLLLAVKFPETYTKLCLGCSETLAHNETDLSRCFGNLLSGYSAFISSPLLMKATGGCRNV